MSNGKFQVPRYCLHKASGKAVVRINGRDVYLGQYGSKESKDNYERLIAETMAKRQACFNSTDGKNFDELSVVELMADYLDFAKGYYVKADKPTGELDNLQLALKPVAKLFGDSMVKDFGPVKLKTVRQSMIDGGISRGVINDRVNRIRRFFKWGVENELVAPQVLQSLQAVSPLKRGRSGAKETMPIMSVPDSQIEAVIQAAPPTIAAMIKIQLLTGMRPGELVAMRTLDIDVHKECWEYRPEHHKTEHHGSQRIIYIGPEAQKVLQPFLKKDLQAYIFDPRDAMKQRYAIRPTHRKTPPAPPKTTRRIGFKYSVGGYARAIKYVCDRNGLQYWAPNRLRHSAATRFRREGGLDVAQVLLGHKTARMTEVYAEPNAQKATEYIKGCG